MPLIDSALSFIAPHHCLGCQDEGQICCQKCLKSLQINPQDLVCYNCQISKDVDYGICLACQRKQSLNGVFWYANYKNKITKDLIKALKFNNVHASSKVMATSLKECIPGEVILKTKFISAVPTANKRVRQRGWDQAKLISVSLAKFLKIPNKTLLIRASSFDQIGASKADRVKSSEKFFKPTRLSLIRDNTIIIVDDLVTTGATLNSAAKTLKSAGAKEVYAVAFARQPLKRSN